MSEIALPKYKDMISRAYVYDLDNAVRASKYPMLTNVKGATSEVVARTDSLASAPIGSGHNNFLSGIIVCMDLTMSNKMCVEWQRYHFQQIVSSQSTMHRITKMDFERAYSKYVDRRVINILNQHIEMYNHYVDMGDTEKAKETYLIILYTNPCGMLLTQRVVTNYLQLKTMYKQRKNHRLPEWRDFCEWIETLPHAEWIIGEDDNGQNVSRTRNNRILVDPLLQNRVWDN